MWLQITSIIFPIVAIVLVGFFYAKKFNPDMQVTNTLNLDVFVPELLFSTLVSKDFNLNAYLLLCMLGAGIVLLSGVFGWLIGKPFGFNSKTFVPPMMFANSGNMGLPLALFAFGKEAIPAAVMLFIVENTLHFTVGAKMIDRKASLLGILRIPMIAATFAGLAISIAGFSIPTLIHTPIEMLGQIAIPLMLFSLGVRLVDIDFTDWKIGLIGAIACPLTGIMAAFCILPFVDLPPLHHAMLIIFATLPPAVLNFMVAEKYNQEPQKVASIVLLGNIFSLVSISLALYIVLPISG